MKDDESIIFYRRAEQADIGFLRKLDRETMFSVVCATFGGWDETQFEKSRPLENTEILSINSLPIGMLRHFIDKNGHYVIQDIQVSPTCQGRGVGTRIITSILEKARRDGQGVRLQVFKKSRARELYVRLGFKQVDETETHYCMEAFPC